MKGQASKEAKAKSAAIRDLADRLEPLIPLSNEFVRRQEKVFSTAIHTEPVLMAEVTFNPEHMGRPYWPNILRVIRHDLARAIARLVVDRHGTGPDGTKQADHAVEIAALMRRDAFASTETPPWLVTK